MNIRRTELNILEVLWEQGEIPASVVYKILEKKCGWKKSTTYTVLERCIKKGFIERIEPNFICKALLNKQDIQKATISDLISDFFGNSKREFIQGFFETSSLTEEELKEIEDIINKRRE